MGANRLTIGQAYMGYKKAPEPIDRTDRWEIDISKTVRLLNDEVFLSCIEKTRLKLSIKLLDPKEDCVRQNALENISLKDNGYYLGLDSNFLNNFLQNERDRFEKIIYKDILQPWGLSFNFMPFIEALILYNKRDIPLVYPNPYMFEIYKKYPLEFIRNTHTISDIKTMVRNLREHFLIPIKPNKQDAQLLNDIKDLMRTIPNKERRTRNTKESNWILKNSKRIGKIERPKVKTTAYTLAMDKNGDWADESTLQKEKGRLTKAIQRERKRTKNYLKK